MQILRDRTRLTRVLVLLELSRTKPGTLAEVARAFGLTVQAVSNYVRALVDEGLVVVAEGRYVPTRQGLQYLQEHLHDIKSVVDGAVRQVNVIETCAARAARAVRKGEPVGLELEDGVLVAWPRRRAASRGVALQDARKGDALAVGHLSGIVEISPGEVTVLAVPPAEAGRPATSATEARRLIAGLPRHERVAVLGVEARVLAERAGLHVDIEFSPARAAVQAAQLGLDVLFLVSRGDVADAVREMEELNARTFAPVTYRILQAGGHARRGRR